MTGSFRTLTRFFIAFAALSECCVARAAGNEAEFRQAYASAEAAEREAGVLRNRWTSTEAGLAEARQAAGKGDFGAATTAAREAEALARASIFQAIQEKEAWKDRVIR